MILRRLRLIEIWYAALILLGLEQVLASHAVNCPGNALQTPDRNRAVTSHALAVTILLDGAKGTIYIGECR